MEKKMTKREMFAAIIANHNLSTEEVDFLKHEIELLEKKAGKDRKPTANQLANAGIKEEIVSILTGAEKMTCTEIAKALQPNHTEDISVNKVSALMKQLVEAKQVVKTIEKRKSYFSVAQSFRWGLVPHQLKRKRR